MEENKAQKKKELEEKELNSQQMVKHKTKIYKLVILLLISIN